MLTREAILARVQADPITHLSCRSLYALEGYECGYDDACRVWSVPPPPAALDMRALIDWLQGQVEVTPEHASRLNSWNWLGIAPWARLLSEDDRAAFDRYFALRAQAPRQHVPPELEPPAAPPTPSETLVEVLRRVRQRPGLWLGNGGEHFVALWGFVRGFYQAECDRGLAPSLAAPLFTSFPDWLAARYPFSRGIPWHRLFSALAIGAALRAFDSFLEHLDLHLIGAPPDTPDPTMVCIIEHIMQQVMEDA